MSELTNAEIAAALTGTPWRLAVGRLRVGFATPDLTAGVRFAVDVADAADAADHHPDIDVRYGYVHLVLVSHDVQAVTDRDVSLARRIAEIATAHGFAASDPSPQVAEIAVDALDIQLVRPFWKAAFAYADGPASESGPVDLYDPRGVGPAIWFQQMDAPREQRNRIHLDVSVASDEAPDRFAAVLAAGGVLVSGSAAPSFWVLADPEGNEVCICTPEGRD